MSFQRDKGNNLFVFTVDGRHFALYLHQVYRTDLAAEVTPLSGSPEFIKGLVNFSGSLLPILDMRVRIGLPKRRIRTSDRLIFTKTSVRHLALLVDDIVGIARHDMQTSESDQSDISGLTKNIDTCWINGDRIVLIQDAEALLDDSEDAALQDALESR